MPVKTEITTAEIRQPFWAMSVPEALSALSSRTAGLTEEEAETRKQKFGPNEFPQARRLTPLRIVLEQLRSPLILVLIGAGVLTAFLQEWVDTAVIFAAVLVNTGLGFWQEWKAETALEALRTYVRTRARVRRLPSQISPGEIWEGKGQEKELDAKELVPGDIIRVTQGDRVPADARLIFSNSLETDEAVLTGESLPVVKDLRVLPAGTGLGERVSMIFSGTLAVAGFGDAVVTATGGMTEFGKIAALVAERERVPTPLQSSLRRFVLRAGAVLAAVVLALFGLGLYVGYGLVEMFLIAVAVAVSAVPEGLPVALTVILAIGVERLARRKGVVRRLLAAETLGSTSLVLTDKTGTLTQAKMELSQIIPFGKKIGTEAELLRTALPNLDVVIENPTAPPAEWRLYGRALETALVRGAAERGVLAPEILGSIEVIDRLPFSSAYRFSAAVTKSSGHHRLSLFGAPEVLIGYSDLPAEARTGLLAEVGYRASSGERVLAVAGGDIPAAEAKIPRDFKFRQLAFKGLLVFRDPLRPGVDMAIRRIADAGVKTVIVTGDHAGTAEAVARELGLVDGSPSHLSPGERWEGKGAVLTGDDLKYLKPEELAARANSVSVYARVTPEEKLSLVKLYRQKGEVVAVTGDGVNDAPALQAADIGLAVGSGTDVAKSAADLVILDDNFETIVAAIEEGRNILSNIRKVIVYLLSDALNELVLIGGALLAGLALPLSALQILFVNFFSDSFPAVALAFERGIDSFGSRPRRLDRNLFDRQMRFLILAIGTAASIFLFALYVGLLRLGFDPPLVRTFIFASFGTYTLFLAFSMRSLDKSILSYNPFSNLYLVAGVGVGLGLTAAVLYVPFLQGIFRTVALPFPWLLGVVGIGIVNIAAVELGKWLFRRRY